MSIVHPAFTRAAVRAYIGCRLKQNALRYLSTSEPGPTLSQLDQGKLSGSSSVDVDNLKNKLIFSEIFSKLIADQDILGPVYEQEKSLKNATTRKSRTSTNSSGTSSSLRGPLYESIGSSMSDLKAKNYLKPWFKEISELKFNSDVIKYFTEVILPNYQASSGPQDYLGPPDSTPLKNATIEDVKSSQTDKEKQVLLVNSETAPPLLNYCLKTLICEFHDASSCLLLVETTKLAGYDRFLAFCDATVFTTLIQIRWIYYRSVPDVIDLINELSHNAIKPDKALLNLLESIRQDIRTARDNDTWGAQGIPTWSFSRAPKLRKVNEAVGQIIAEKDLARLSFANIAR